MANAYRKNDGQLYVKCFKCKTETLSSCAIDYWCIHDDEFYCSRCQRELYIGLYENTEKIKI